MARTLQTQIKLDTSSFVGALRDALGLSEQQAAKIEKSLGSIKADIDTRALKSGLKDAEDQAGKSAASIRDKLKEGFNISNFVGGLAAGVGVGALSAVTSGISSIAKAMIEGNAQMEEYQTQFTTMMGSADLAKERLAELAKFGAETPFELPELAAAEKVLIGFGLQGQKSIDLTGKSASELRTIIGDVAAGTGVKFNELAVTFGKFSAGATGEAIARLQELGIVTKEQLKGVGVEFDKAGSLVSPLPVAMQAAVKIAQEKFGGGMAALSQTASGQMSTLSDNIAATARTAGAPIFEAFKNIVAGVNKILSSGGFSAAINAAGKAFAFLLDVMTTAAPLIAVYVIVMNASAIATGIATAAQKLFNAAMAANPIGLVIAGIIAAVAAYKALSDALEVTAEEQLAEAEAARDGIKAQVDANAERKKSVESTQSLVKEFEQLEKKANRTKEEEKRLLEIQAKLDQQYPNLIDQTKSFGENLNGVREIGKQTTAEIGKLGEEGEKLAKQLKEAERTILFAKRNVAQSELLDEASLGTWERFGFMSQEVRRALSDTGAAAKIFNDEIFKAKTTEEVTRALAKFSDVVNGTQGAFANANDSARYLAIYTKAQEVAQKASQALQGVVEVNQELAAPPPPPDDKDKETALARALKRYEKEEESIKALNNTKRTAVKLDESLTPVEQDIKLKEIDAQEAEALLVKARDIFQATTDKRNLFVGMKIVPKPGEETDAEVREIFNKLALLLKPEIQADINVGPGALERFARILGVRLREIQPKLPPVKLEVSPADPDVVEDFATSIASALDEAFAKKEELSDEATQKELDNIQTEENAMIASLKKRETSLDAFNAKINELSAKRAALQPKDSVVEQLFGSLRTGTFQGAANELSKFAAKYGAAAGEMIKKGESIGDVTLKIGESAVYAFGSMLAEAVAQGDVTFGNLLQMLAKTVRQAFELLVPLVLTEFTAWLGPIAGPIVGAIAVAGFQKLLDAAVSGIGAETGVVGITKSYSKARGRTDTIPLWVAEGETIHTREATKHNRDLFAAIQRNPSSWYKDGSIRDTLLKKLGVGKEAGARIELTASGRIRETDRGGIMDKVGPKLLEKIDMLTNEVRSLRTKIKTMQEVHVVPHVDEGGLLSRIDTLRFADVRGY